MKTHVDEQATTLLQTMTAPATIERRYDVDWLRVIAVFSVIALHSAVIFSFGQFIVQHTQHSVTVDTIVIFFSIWVIPLLFVLAGAATKFSLDRRTPKAYSSERVKRLLLTCGYGSAYLQAQVPFSYRMCLGKCLKHRCKALLPQALPALVPIFTPGIRPQEAGLYS